MPSRIGWNEVYVSDLNRLQALHLHQSLASVAEATLEGQIAVLIYSDEERILHLRLVLHPGQGMWILGLAKHPLERMTGQTQDR